MKDSTLQFYKSLFWGSAIALAVFFLSPGTGNGLVQRLCDCFFVAAVLVCGIGCLGFARNQGLFDMLGYGVGFVFHLHTRPGDNSTDKETYIDYRKRKAQTRRSTKPSILAGLVFLVLALIMLGIYLLSCQ